MKNYYCYLLFFLLFVFGCQNTTILSVKPLLSDSHPQLNCRNAILMAPDQNPPQILFAKGESDSIPPASMTKLITSWLLIKKCIAEELPLTHEIIIPSMADYRNLPSDSSLMFLTAGIGVSLGELLSGLMVSSGNDGAYAVAHFVSGGVDAFVKEMNRVSLELLLQYTTNPVTLFVDPSGYSSNNVTTPLEFAYLTKALIDEFEALPAGSATSPNLYDYTGLNEFTYAGVTQYNHNELVGRYPGVVGMKTGFINKSGANVSLLVEREGTRLIAVLMGGPGENSYQRSLKRISDASQLLTWGFSHFVEWAPSYNREFILDGAEKRLYRRDDLMQTELIIKLPKSFRATQEFVGTRVGSWSLKNGDYFYFKEEAILLKEEGKQ